MIRRMTDRPMDCRDVSGCSGALRYGSGGKGRNMKRMSVVKLAAHKKKSIEYGAHLRGRVRQWDLRI